MQKIFSKKIMSKTANHRKSTTSPHLHHLMTPYPPIRLPNCLTSTYQHLINSYPCPTMVGVG